MVSGKLNVMDLFCGAGGMSEGFQMAGFNILSGVEFNEMAAKTFSKNHPNAKTIIRDITKVSKEEILSFTGGKKIHGVVGGPPCQGFSDANRRKKRNDKRNRLYLEFIRIVNDIKPDFFVMENVRGILSDKNTRIIQNIKKSLGTDYSVNHKILLAADYGVPQLRRRAFIVGLRGRKEFTFPSQTHSRIPDCGSGLKKWIGVGKCLLPREKASENLFYSEKLIRGFIRREKKNRKRKIGFRWQFLDEDKPSYTIPARYWKDGANALVKYSESEIRMLDTKECASIQTFPSDFVFLGSKKQIYEQIGNAVPPLMAFRIADVIKNSIE